MSTPTTTSVPSRRFDRASWLTVTIVVGFAAACALVMGLILRQPSDGCVLDVNTGATIYACVGDWATPLRPGDRVLAVAGVNMARGALLLGEGERLAGRAGAATLPYTVERSGERLDLAVPLHRLDGPVLLHAFGAALAAFADWWPVYFFIGAAVIFALAPRARAAQLLLVAGGTGAAGATLVWAPQSIATDLLAPAPLYYSRWFLASFWAWLLVPTLLLLVLSFPRRVWLLARWPRATPALLYGLPLAALAAVLLTSNNGLYGAMAGLEGVGFITVTVVVMGHTFWRVRDPVVRAQAAWLGLGLMLGVGVWPVLYALEVYFLPPEAASGAAIWINSSLQAVTGVGFAVCLGIAITRYRLFDIAVVINRALVYSLLTAALAAVYLGGVALVQGVVRALTGQESDLAIVAATLAVAACFQPLRGRIQAFIDRRFYRQKYDAVRILAAYSAALRDEVDVDRLTAELLSVAQGTVQPAHLSLWLRQDDESARAASQPGLGGGA
jgi:hypothetical protein